MNEMDPQLDTLRPGCRAFDMNLAAYLEGEDRPEVSRHAPECDYCRVVLADLEALRETSSKLPLPEPPARLWANIRSTLEAEGVIRLQTSFWRRWFPIPRLAPEARPVGALLALATLVAVVLVGSTRTYETPRPSDILLPGSAVNAAGISVPGLSESLKETVAPMETAFRDQEDSFEPALKDSYKKSLEALDVSIQETTGQCERHPADQLAKQYLVNAYQAKAEVLASALESNR